MDAPVLTIQSVAFGDTRASRPFCNGTAICPTLWVRGGPSLGIYVH